MGRAFRCVAIAIVFAVVAAVVAVHVSGSVAPFSHFSAEDREVLRAVEDDLTCDLEDALDIADAGARGGWMAVYARADRLGWTVDVRTSSPTRSSSMWLRGRRLYVLLEADERGVPDVTEVYLPQGLVVGSLRRPELSVCGGPALLPFPTFSELAAVVDQCDAGELVYVAALHRVLCAWFDVRPMADA